jgi:hypothetical protein
MRSLLAAALGLGLLSAGAMMGSAASAPFHDQAPGRIGVQTTPVHYEHGYHPQGYHRPHYAPPPHHGWRRQRHDRYGWR